MRNEHVKIITITGPSGAGKTSIARELLIQNGNLRLIISLTSRPERPSDLSGEYRAKVSREEFIFRKVRYEFLWTAHIHGNWYGTLRSDVDYALAQPHASLMLLVPETVYKIQQYAYGRVLSFYIFPPGEKQLRERLLKRGDDLKDIEQRIADCRKWDREALDSNLPYFFIANTGPLDETVKKINAILPQ